MFRAKCGCDLQIPFLRVISIEWQLVALKNGTFYLYTLMTLIQGIFLSQIKHTEDWRCDQYRLDNQGVARLPRKNPKVRKLYFNADTPTGSSKEFQRRTYQLLEDKSLTLVQYIGGEGAAKDFLIVAPYNNQTSLL